MATNHTLKRRLDWSKIMFVVIFAAAIAHGLIAVANGTGLIHWFK